MTRFSGKVGYGESQEIPTDSGIWKDVVTEYPYKGDVVRNTKNNEPDDQANPNITVGNSIRIVADEYANSHFFNIKYVWWQGKAWTVTRVEADPDRPRLTLSLGKIYNGPFPEED